MSAAARSIDSGTNPVAGSSVPGAVPARSDQELPLVDVAVLQDLEEQLGRTDIVWNFANDYAVMWGQRQQCIVDSVELEDGAAALDAVISLKVSSAMVGGLRLARLAEALELSLRKGDLQTGASVLAMISFHGPATVKELQARYLEKEPAAADQEHPVIDQV